MWKIMPYKLESGERFIINQRMVKITKVKRIPLIGYLTFFIKDFFREGEF